MVDRAVADPVPMAPRTWLVAAVALAAVAMGPVAMTPMVALIPPRAPMVDPAMAKPVLPMADLAVAKLPTVDLAMAMEGMAMVALNLAMVAMVEAVVAVVVEQGMATMDMVGAKDQKPIELKLQNGVAI